MTPLHQIGDILRELLLGIPLGMVRLLFVTALLAVLIWVLLLPKHQTRPENAKPRVTENLKVWAAVALIIQIAIYTLI